MATALYEMRLAIEAIRVPSPPKLTPISISCHSEVNPESNSAAGTLLIIWLRATPIIMTLPSKISDKKLLNSGILPTLPMKINKAMKVISNE